MSVFGCANDEQFIRESKSSFSLEHKSVCSDCRFYSSSYNSCTNKHFCEKLKLDYDNLLGLLSLCKK